MSIKQNDAKLGIQSAYPNSLIATQLVVFDQQKQKEYLVRDYKEQSSLLRNQHPTRRIIKERVLTGLAKKFHNKSYLPVTASVLTGLISLASIGGSQPSEDFEERISYTLSPATRIE